MKKLGTTMTNWIRSATKILPIIAGLAGLAMVIAWISGMFTGKIKPGEMETVARTVGDHPTEVVHEVVKDYIEESVGTLKAASRSVISAKILATIQEINVTAGDFVEQGDLLVSLNTREQETRLNQTREDLAAAKAATQEAEADYNRNAGLLESNAISRREFEESERKLQVARANERRANQAVEEARVLLSYSTIRAPRAGRIVDRSAEPGDTKPPFWNTWRSNCRWDKS